MKKGHGFTMRDKSPNRVEVFTKLCIYFIPGGILAGLAFFFLNLAIAILMLFVIVYLFVTNNSPFSLWLIFYRRLVEVNTYGEDDRRVSAKMGLVTYPGQKMKD